jgi:hypothetical protein
MVCWRRRAIVLRAAKTFTSWKALSVMAAFPRYELETRTANLTTRSSPAKQTRVAACARLGDHLLRGR